MAMLLDFHAVRFDFSLPMVLCISLWQMAIL